MKPSWGCCVKALLGVPGRSRIGDTKQAYQYGYPEKTTTSMPFTIEYEAAYHAIRPSKHHPQSQRGTSEARSALLDVQTSLHLSVKANAHSMQ